ncbi:hypothetical protein TW81_01365 [Vibrio galatheae]|uniref:YjiS-like domain-containing protein n=1 Tax=Vibrio galatheae TaxID=579748 RepID=A0A0F4NPD1_9VIBR|nr:DUF1127 domain-containing protein [Vibrio galatheae]KJY85000.1 hypothetical protein TW81_01365 [Vibrio galatheae]
MDTSNYAYKQKALQTFISDNKILTKVTRWWRNFTTRRQLQHLSSHLLNDIGLTKEQAQQESYRHFWDK